MGLSGPMTYDYADDCFRLPQQLPELPEVRRWFYDLLLREEQSQADLRQLEQDWQQVQSWCREDERLGALLLEQLGAESLALFWARVGSWSEDLRKILSRFNESTGRELEFRTLGSVGIVAGALALPVLAPGYLAVAVLGTVGSSYLGALSLCDLRDELERINQSMVRLHQLRCDLEQTCANVALQLQTEQ